MRRAMRDPAELRRRPPGLIGRVQRGAALIDLPPQHRVRMLAALAQTHRRHLAEREQRAVPMPDWQCQDSPVDTLPTMHSPPDASPDSDSAGGMHALTRRALRRLRCEGRLRP